MSARFGSNRIEGKGQKAKGKKWKAKDMTDKPRDIVERTFRFALAVVRLCKACEHRSGTAPRLARQLLRSATSVGANVEEAQAGQSRADFVSKYSIALKEARETRYWLRLLIESGDCSDGSGTAHCQEADELMRIIAAIIVKTKENAATK